jgi:dolichyl-phosphate beta-glucosyltransferase
MGLMPPEVSIIIPAYNEARRLPETLNRLERYISARGLRAEVIVVDDGSVDATAQIVRERAAGWPALCLLCAPTNKGKGAAVQLGMGAARGRYRIFSDADLSVPIDDLDKVLAPLRAGAAVAIASRGLATSDVQRHQPWRREAMGALFNLLVRFLVMDGIRDTQCGFKAFTAEAAQRLFPPLQTPGFGFDVEVLYRARQAGYAIVEVPTRWVNSPLTTVRASQGLRAFCDLLLIPRRVRKHSMAVTASQPIPVGTGGPPPRPSPAGGGGRLT